MRTHLPRRGRGTPDAVPVQVPVRVPVQDSPPPRTSRTYQLRTRLNKKLLNQASQPAMTPDARAGLMGVSRRGALVVITLLDLAATAVSFGESWDALYQWAIHHGLKGFWAFAFPLQIDTFIAMGELALFIAILDHWYWRSRIWAWISTFGGLAVSMVGNVGHVSDHPGSWQATASVPPLAAMAGMFIGFQVLKRVMSPTKKAVQDQETQELINQLRRQIKELAHVPAPSPEPVHVPEQRPAPEPVRTLPDFIHHDGRPTPPTPRTSMGQDRPEIVREQTPKAPTQPRRRGDRHPRWDEAVKLYTESGATKADRLGVNKLTAALGLKNKSLAARVIDHVESSGE